MDRRARTNTRIAAALLLALGCNRIEVAPEASPSAMAPAAAEESATPVPAPELALILRLDDRFELDRQEGAAMILRLPDVPDVELWMAVGRDPVGGEVPASEALVERALQFLEPVHGEVTVSTTGAGDALLAFSGSMEDGNRMLHAWNWMVLRPGKGDVLRADISLRIPDAWAKRADMQGLAGHVAERLAGAQFDPDS